MITWVANTLWWQSYCCTWIDDVYDQNGTFFWKMGCNDVRLLSCRKLLWVYTVDTVEVWRSKQATVVEIEFGIYSIAHIYLCVTVPVGRISRSHECFKTKRYCSPSSWISTGFQIIHRQSIPAFSSIGGKILVSLLYKYPEICNCEIGSHWGSFVGHVCFFVAACRELQFIYANNTCKLTRKWCVNPSCLHHVVNW